MDEPHAVVRLLIARMESHPEEFKRDVVLSADRWHVVVAEITEWGNEVDRAALDAGMRGIRLGEAHKMVMDELLNGEDRRRK